MFMIALMTSFVTILIGYIVWYWHKCTTYWQRHGIPCRKPHWLMGNFDEMMQNISAHEYIMKYYLEFKGKGPFVGLYMSLKPTVFVLDVDLIKNILIKDFSNFTDRGFYSNEEDDPLSGQLFLLDGIKWKNMRNKLSPAFTTGKLRSMFPLVLDTGNRLLKVLEMEALRNDDGHIEIKDLLARYTTDVIGSCAFGIECHSLEDPLAPFRIMGRRSVKEQRYGPRLMSIIMSFPNISRKLHIKTFPDDIEKFFINLVKDTVNYREVNDIRRGDFMDTLIDLKNNKLIKMDTDDELTNLTLNQIAAQAFVFFNAGFETSSTTMSFALYELALHENVQAKARSEIAEVLDKHQHQITYDCLRDCHYLEQIVMETLRLYNIVPMLNRVALNDYKVPGTNFTIAKGMPIIIPVSGIHRDPEYYANPDEFNPDNFTMQKVQERDSCLHLPFGEGPRNCVGLRFGKMQTILGLLLLLKAFKFSVCPKTEMPIKFDATSFTLASEKGIYLKVVKIQKKLSTEN